MKITHLFGVVIIGLLIAQLIVAVKISSTGKVLTHLEEESNKLVIENRRLEEKVANYTALSTISSRSAELGLVKHTQIIYLTPNVPQANVLPGILVP